MKAANKAGTRRDFLPAGNTKIKKLWGDRIFDIVNALIMILICMVIAYPLYYVLVASLTDPTVVNSGKVLLFPEKLFIGGYKKIFEYRPIWTGYANTLIYTVCGTAAAMAATIPCAFALSRRALFGRRILNFLFTFTMFFSGGIVPTYILMNNLHLIDNFWVMILPSAVGMFNVIIMRTYFQTNIPQELEDAANVDGCTNFRFLLRIALPLSIPIVVVVALYYGVAHWNDYFSAMMYLTKRQMYPLQLVLREILLENEAGKMLNVATDAAYAERMMSRMGLKYAVIVISTLPILVIYPFVQKFFSKGIMVGAVKG